MCMREFTSVILRENEIVVSCQVTLSFSDKGFVVKSIPQNVGDCVF